MDKLVRAMVGLLKTVAGVPGSATFRLTQEEFAPAEAQRLGSQSLVPGCIVLQIERRGDSFFERYYYGYWEHE